MKLKNKTTGEIGRLTESNHDEYEYLVIIDGNPQVYRYYHTLKEVADNYEDYKEPKEFWHILCDGKVNRVPYNEHCYYQEREIGNYFETKEEAKKAVEKLKAWKRLQKWGLSLCGGERLMVCLIITKLLLTILSITPIIKTK